MLNILTNSHDVLIVSRHDGMEYSDFMVKVLLDEALHEYLHLDSRLKNIFYCQSLELKAGTTSYGIIGTFKPRETNKY
jgi:hypothetical protein